MMRLRIKNNEVKIESGFRSLSIYLFLVVIPIKSLSIKQQKRDYKEQLRNSQTLITITYRDRPVGVTGDLWQESQGILGTYENVKALYEIVTNLTYKSYPFSEVAIGKVIFRIDFDGYNFDNGRRFIKVFYNDQKFEIDKAMKMVDFGNGKFLAWFLIQK